MKLAIVLVLLVIFTLVFHFVSPWWFTPLASNWSSIDFTVNVTFWVTGLVFIAVNLFLAYVVFRYRYSPKRKADYDPENRKLETSLTLLTTVGVVLMLAPGLFVWAKFIDVPKNASQVEVLAQQWHWSYRFPGEDGVFGKTHAHFISDLNPMGLDPKDLNGQDDIIVEDNQLHLPQGQPAKVLLRSKDVLHNFAVPQFRVKMDAVPGLVSYVWFTPEKLGVYDILCMELCGIAHYAMRGKVVVETSSEFKVWLAEQPTFAQSQQTATRDLAAGKSLYMVCASCHGQQAQGSVVSKAPALAGQHQSYIVRQLQHYQQSIRGTYEADDLGRQMASMSSTLPDLKALQDVAAYVESLSHINSPATIRNADVKRGEKVYQNCARCHGQEGEGNLALSAPKLAGLQDWYVRRQIHFFQHGLRGGHEADYFGNQMQLLAKTLNSEQAIDDVAVFISQMKNNAVQK
ncbi:Alternative cytochrome c oxidase subunit 2 [Thalassocella blandensis]|nr:Alternative cytochrome c oxidase subunit 2 [Thalassocella blandensis]